MIKLRGIKNNVMTGHGDGPGESTPGKQRVRFPFFQPSNSPNAAWSEAMGSRPPLSSFPGPFQNKMMWASFWFPDLGLFYNLNMEGCTNEGLCSENMQIPIPKVVVFMAAREP